MRGFSSCGQENPGGFRFCGACGSPLADVPRQPEGEERKVVTVLFCDLVGFTSRSDRADPEDVGAILRPFHRRLRSEIERVGGTLDKLIGDAVMAVFGVPAVHEDDPELAVRIGINTGEALVSLARGTDSEGVVGDVVNTAARLQGVAPVNGVVVGEATWRATRTLFAYHQLAPVQVKGKAEPLPIFRVLGARSRPGVDVAERPATPLIGRGEELATLQRCYREAFGEHAVQLVTILGEPGVWQEPAGAGARRLRRCPAGAGRLAPGPLPVLRRGCRLLGPRRGHQGPGRHPGIGRPGGGSGQVGRGGPGCRRRRLGARVAEGAACPAGGVRDRQRDGGQPGRVLHGVAAFPPARGHAGPSDPGHRGSALGRPGHARVPRPAAGPGGHGRSARGGHGQAGAARPSPGLGDGTAQCDHRVAGPPRRRADRGVARRPARPVDVAGGGAVAAAGASWRQPAVRRGVRSPAHRPGAADRARQPGVRVRPAIAGHGAGLDRGAPGQPRAGAQDPAPGRRRVRQGVWSGALAAMGGASEAEVRAGLAQLERKELIRAARRSAVENEAEYSFWHAIVRDVAYAQIPRTGRSRRHRVAAEWIQALAGDRVADRAELIAHHFTQALVHARAAREPGLAELEESTRRALVLAGDSTMGLDVAGAEAYYRQALDLCPAGTPGRARVLARAARAAFQVGRVAEAASGYEEAIDGFAAEGDVVGQGEALSRLSSVLWNQGETRRTRDALVRAVELLEGARPGPELCSAYAQMAMDRVMSGHPQEALSWADKALALAEELGGLPEERLRALDSRGVARGDLGDLGGMDDLRAALDIGLEVGAGFDTAVVYNNLIEPLWLSEGPAAALETCRQALEFTERCGLAEGTAWIRSATLTPLLDLGRWDEAVAAADALITWEREHGGQYMAEMAHQVKANVLLWRGELDAARVLAGAFLPRARDIDDLQLLVPALAVA